MSSALRRLFVYSLNRKSCSSVFYSPVRNFSQEAAGVIRSPYSDVDIPDVSLPEFLFRDFDLWPDKIAFECSVTKRRYTFQELRLKSRNLAKSFKEKLKLHKGDVVAVLLPNMPEFPLIFCAAFQAGVIITTVNPLYTAEEISRQLVDAGAKAIITLNVLSNTAFSAINLAKKNIPVIIVKTEQSESLSPGTINLSEFIDINYDKSDLMPPEPDDIAAMPYSSGTTGLPKGVEISHRNLVANIMQGTHPELRVHEPTTETHQDILPAVLPMFHIYGLTNCTLYPMKCGLKTITLPKFAPDLFTSVLQDYKPTIMMIVPPIEWSANTVAGTGRVSCCAVTGEYSSKVVYLGNMLTKSGNCRSNIKQFTYTSDNSNNLFMTRFYVNFMNTSPMMKKEYLKSIRAIYSGAAPLGALDEAKFLQKAERDINILQGYGLTETSPVVCLLTAERKRETKVLGSVGDPVSNTTVKIVSVDTNEPVKKYEKGELLVKGPQVMKGYHNKPIETAETLKDGWLRTGDLAYYDDNNLVFITDRLKELIKVKGFQVAPAELEELIRDYPDVEDAAVIGIPHANYGEVPRAYIVPKSGRKLNADKLNEYLETKVTNYKLLRGGVAVVDSIPKNAAGKILRRQLKLRYENEKK